jgi:prepilin-type processing-associated H-X9-DG protein
MHPGNSYRLYAKISNRDQTMLGCEADPVMITGPCGCRFTKMRSPTEIDPTHDGAGHVLFADGTVRGFRERSQRRISYWERVGGLPPAP